jgi:hypothetical protein
MHDEVERQETTVGKYFHAHVFLLVFLPCSMFEKIRTEKSSFNIERRVVIATSEFDIVLKLVITARVLHSLHCSF